MKSKLKLFIPLVLICSMLFGSVCFASGTSRGWIYNSNQLNAQVINQFNSLSRSEQSELIKTVFPIISKALGFLPKGSDAYTPLNRHYMSMLNARKTSYPDASDLASSDDLLRYNFVYSQGGEWFYFSSFADYLATKISLDNGQLVVNDTSGFYNITNDYIESTFSDMGLVNREVYSYKNINSSNFPNLESYNSFINLVNNYKDSRFILCYRGSSSLYFGTVRNYFTVIIPKASSNLYATSSTDGIVYALCNDNGVNLGSNSYYIFVFNGSTWQDMTSSHGKYGARPPFYLGGPSLPVGGLLNFPNSYELTGNFYVYSTNDDVQTYRLFTSLSGWVNGHGHFETPYSLTKVYNNVPTTTISSRDMTNLYNYIINNNNNYYSDDDTNITNNDTTTNIYYPSDFDGEGNKWDPDDLTLDFSGIGALISSIGAFIGSIINGIASGIANIINSLTSVTSNLINFFTQGSLFSFLKVFLAWLPEPIPTLLISLFTLSVMFAVIKLVKGAFS